MILKLSILPAQMLSLTMRRSNLLNGRDSILVIFSNFLPNLDMLKLVDLYVHSVHLSDLECCDWLHSGHVLL